MPRVRGKVLLGLLLVSAWLIPHHFVARATQTGSLLDHFLGYEVERARHAPRFEPRDVILTDEFVTGTFEVKKAEQLQNPAQTTFNDSLTPIGDPFTHLLSYRIDPKGCQGCEGGITSLTLQYNGSETASILITAAETNEVLFGPASIDPGGDVLVSFSDEGRRLGKEIKVAVNLDGERTETTIPTDCSPPIGVGLKFGEFTVVEGRSLKGGPLKSCPLPVQSLNNCGECGGGVTSLTFRNNGPDALILVTAVKKVGDDGDDDSDGDDGDDGDDSDDEDDDGSDDDSKKELFNGFVAGGDSFTVTGVPCGLLEHAS